MGYVDQQPVTSSTVLLTEGMASIYNVSTPEAYRRRGFGTAITWFMIKIRAVLGWMDEAIQDNYTHWEAEHLRRWADIVDKIWE